MKLVQAMGNKGISFLWLAIFLLTLPLVCVAQEKIVFRSDRDGNREIYKMDADGTNQVRLTNNPAIDSEPNLSRDGLKIVFVSNRDGNREIYLMNADGTNQLRMTNNSAIDADPAFSADGTRIVFVSDGDIYTMQASDASGLMRLTNSPGDDLQPSFSPDGTKIVFSAQRDVASFEIYIMNAADGSNETRLTFDPDWDDIDPSFNSSGSKIVFSSVRDQNYEIYVMDPDGANQTRLTFFATQPTTFAREPSFSPDGSKIAFTFFQNNHLEVYVMNANGTNQTRLTNTPSDNQDPSWGGHQAIAAQTKLKISNGNILIGSAGNGIILRSPSGAACRLLSINNAGALVVTTPMCP